MVRQFTYLLAAPFNKCKDDRNTFITIIKVDGWFSNATNASFKSIIF